MGASIGSPARIGGLISGAYSRRIRNPLVAHGITWAAHPRPYADELLSSWIVRVAHANGLKLQTFCHIEFGEFEIWNRDIDRQAPEWLLQRLAARSGRAFAEVWNMTLAGYESRLYYRRHSNGQQRWILPLQTVARSPKGFGLQYCPACLAADAAPYFRRAWRVALYTFCPLHRILMADRCPGCDSPVALHRLDVGRSDVYGAEPLSLCWNCGFNLRNAPQSPVHEWDCRAFASWRRLLTVIRNERSSRRMIDVGRLDVLHHFCRLLASMPTAFRFLGYVRSRTGQRGPEIERGRFAFEHRPLAERHHLLSLGWWLMGKWPSRVRSAWKSKAIRYNLLLKDFANPPDWYAAAVQDFNRRNLAGHRHSQPGSQPIVPL
ncbi:MAG: TniQ family protein [Betaproteobacteria bacterium]|nr:TniQ family protein [Betaproteobacteria bacterium]